MAIPFLKGRPTSWPTSLSLRVAKNAVNNRFNIAAGYFLEYEEGILNGGSDVHRSSEGYLLSRDRLAANIIQIPNAKILANTDYMKTTAEVESSDFGRGNQGANLLQIVLIPSVQQKSFEEDANNALTTLNNASEERAQFVG